MEKKGQIKMKITAVCPKCKSENILKIPGDQFSIGRGTNIPTGLSKGSVVEVVRYFCSDCGYLESWVDTEENRKKVIKKYKK